MHLYLKKNIGLPAKNFPSDGSLVYIADVYIKTEWILYYYAEHKSVRYGAVNLINNTMDVGAYDSQNNYADQGVWYMYVRIYSM